MGDEFVRCDMRVMKVIHVASESEDWDGRPILTGVLSALDPVRH